MEDIVKGIGLLLEFQNILLILSGVLIGVLVGALPGLSSPMAIALLIPFTISLDPVAAIAMMAALYCAGTFGGSITAILINAPGLHLRSQLLWMDIQWQKMVNQEGLSV